MSSRAKRLPKLRKIDVRVPIVRERSSGWDSAAIGLVERAVLDMIDGQRTVHAIAESAGVADEAIASTLDTLVEMRLVVLIEPGRRASAAPPVRLESGVRPALATSPAFDDHELTGATPLPASAPAADEADGDRVTLLGIGPDRAAG